MPDQGGDFEHMHVVRQLVDYLIHHPDAKDTLDGVHAFWLVRERGGPQIAVVVKALDYLENRGWVRTSKYQAAPLLYSANKLRFAEMVRARREWEGSDSSNGARSAD